MKTHFALRDESDTILRKTQQSQPRLSFRKISCISTGKIQAQKEYVR